MIKKAIIDQLERILGRDFNENEDFPTLNDAELVKLRAESNLLEIVHFESALNQVNNSERREHSAKLPLFSSVQPVTESDVSDSTTPDVNQTTFVAHDYKIDFVIQEMIEQIGRDIRGIENIVNEAYNLTLTSYFEAAEVGEYGREFFALAYDMLRLAQHSADTAKLIVARLDSSREKVDIRRMLVIDASKTLIKLAKSIKRVAELVNEIRKTVHQQNFEIKQSDLPHATLGLIAPHNLSLVEAEIFETNIFLESIDNIWKVDSQKSLEARAKVQIFKMRRRRHYARRQKLKHPLKEKA